jgi:hypothetical protein
MEIVKGENGGVDILEGDSSWRKDVGIGRLSLSRF